MNVQTTEKILIIPKTHAPLPVDNERLSAILSDSRKAVNSLTSGAKRLAEKYGKL